MAKKSTPKSNTTLKSLGGKISTKGAGRKGKGIAGVSHGKTTTLKRPKI